MALLEDWSGIVSGSQQDNMNVESITRNLWPTLTAAQKAAIKTAIVNRINATVTALQGIIARIQAL